MQPGHDDNGASLQIHRTVMLYLDMHKGKPAKQMLQKRVIFSFTDVGLAQILTEVVEEVRLSIDREVNGADLLYSLLSAPWLYSLLRVCSFNTYTYDYPVLTLSQGRSLDSVFEEFAAVLHMKDLIFSIGI